MELFEEFVMWHLTRTGQVFICPQYELHAGWARPDFLALDYMEKAVKVVEVSAAGWPNGLLNRVENREQQWFGKLREELRRRGIIDDSWNKFQVVLYIREDAAKRFKERLGDPNDVVIQSFEKLGLPWEWDWAFQKADKQAAESG